MPITEEDGTPKYFHGHHESVLRSHGWRTAQNSCAYLLPHLLPNMHILDIGCGPGTITNDLAALVPSGSVIGIDPSEDVLQKARENASVRGVTNVSYAKGDIFHLDFPDGTFDVVHVHQVLQHIRDPVAALREMKRVAKRGGEGQGGGIVAVRESIYDRFIWYPESVGIEEWNRMYTQVAKSIGTEPNAGRMLHVWAREAGFDMKKVKCSVSCWCYSGEEDRKWWSQLWADRTVKSNFANVALEKGLASEESLQDIKKNWLEFGEHEDAWFVVPSGEILCAV